MNTQKPWFSNPFQRNASHKSSPNDTPPNEHSSLLPKVSPASSVTEAGETYEVEDGDKSSTKLWRTEFLILLKGSLPVILAYTLQNSLQTVSVLVVGRLSPEALATAAFSYMFAMSTAWLVALGGTTALDTLASSSYTGSKNPHDLGILLQRGFVVLTMFYIPVAILWLFSAPVFRLLGQEEYICVQSAQFLSALIPGGLGYIYFEAMKKYLQAQGKLTLSLTAYIADICSRNHASRHLRPPNHIAPQRRPKLSFRLPDEHGPHRRPNSHRNSILALLPPPSPLRPPHRRLQMLGRLVPRLPLQHAHILQTRRHGNHPRRHRMVGL